MEEGSLTKYLVEYEPVFDPSIDFVLPTQACGEKVFGNQKDALEFAKKIRQSTIKVGPNPGQEVFGHELEIRLSKLVSVSTEKIN